MFVRNPVYDDMLDNYVQLFYLSPVAFGIILLITVAILALCLISLWKIFLKCNIKPWYCLVPFCNTYMLYKLIWGNGLIMILNFIPILNVAVPVLTQFKLAKAFGQKTEFGIGLIFLSAVYLPMLAFGDNQYYGPRPVFKDQQGKMHWV